MNILTLYMNDLSWNFNFVDKSTNFKCKRCATCCSLDVMLNDDEIKYFGKSVDINWRTTKKLLKGSSMICCFLKGKTCTIYDHRPKLCRAYPFSSVPEDDLSSLNVNVPPSALRIQGNNGKKYLIIYDDECPGMGKGERDISNCEEILSLKTNTEQA